MNDLQVLVQLLSSYGYLILFLSTIVLGPITMVAGGIIASLGYFNIWLVLLVIFLSDTGGDVVYYWIGYSSNHFMLWRPVQYLVSKRKIHRLERFLKMNLIKLVIILKLSPLIGPLGMVVLGSTRPKFKTFLKTSILVSIPKTFLFVFVGYFFGQAYDKLEKILAQGERLSLVILSLFILYFLYLKLTKYIIDKINR